MGWEDGWAEQEVCLDGELSEEGLSEGWEGQSCLVGLVSQCYASCACWRTD